MLTRLVRSGARLPEPVRRRLRDLPGAKWLRDRGSGTPQATGPGPGELRPVVYLPTWSQWDVMRQRQQYLMAAFAEAGHDVYFVDVRVKEVTTSDGVTIVPSLDDVPGHDVILYLHFAPVRTLLPKFERPVVIYDILDDLSIYEPDEARTPPRRRVAAHHPAFIAEADVVTVSNAALGDRHRSERADLLLMPSGVDYARFSTPQPRPADLSQADPERPLVGYHGAIAEWFDFDLLETVAAALPEWRFVLVGPIYPRVAERTERLGRIDNVTVLGERPSDDMPAYVQGFDIGAIWFVVDDLTEAVTPLKLYELLAAGVPCVSTPLPVCVAEPLVHTAAESADFVEELEEARTEAADSAFREKARSLGEAAGWVGRITPLREQLDSAGLLRMPEP
jgi:glycosyltransferase involved in cell wall biosynthesis